MSRFGRQHPHDRPPGTWSMSPALALAWEVKPDKAEAVYEHGLLRIEVPFKDPMRMP